MQSETPIEQCLDFYISVRLTPVLQEESQMDCLVAWQV